MPLLGAERQKRYRAWAKENREYGMLKAKYALQVKKGREAKRRNEKLLNMSTQKKLQQKRQQEAVKKRFTDHRRRQKEAAKDNARHVPFNSAISFAKAAAKARRAIPPTPLCRKAISRRLYATEYDEIPCPSSSSTFTRSTALSEETLNRVTKYYQHDDI